MFKEINLRNHSSLHKIFYSLYDGVGGITASIQLYDENNQLINIDEAHPGYLTVSSLNSFGKSEWAEKEKAQLLSSGEAMQIPESAVTVHKDNIVYSDRDINTMQDASEYERKTYSGWDNANSPAKIFASGLFKVTGNQIKIRSFYGNNDNSGAWFAWSTTVPQTSFDAEGPQKPTATIHYHDNVIQIPATITVKYVDQETGKEIPDTQFEQKGNEGDSITYTTKDTIDKLQSQDYELVSDEYTGKAGDKLSEANNGKTYVVTLRKQHEDKPITPEVKDGTQTYHFVVKTTGEVLTTDKVGENVDVHLKVPDGYHLVEGQTVPTSANIKDEDNPINILVEKDPTPTKPSTPETKDGKQTIHIIDKKTGNVLTTVVKGGKIGENIPVSLKVPKGYHLVQGQKLPTSVNIKDKDNAINVYVEKDEAKPAVTTPSKNNNSKATPASVENAKAPANIANASVKAPSTPVANNTTDPKQEATLPQTGNSSSTAGVVAGSALSATMATLGIAYKKRKN
ncbi:GbpC/Spa domain-containing protein [Lactobacillus crispatus]|uniref:mucin-binding protein n=1 Tax=Lactobacillus crispatus TaxID=47770 RepID=UPI0030F9365D